MKEDIVWVVIKAPGEKAKVELIPDKLGELQRIVGGYIETVRLRIGEKQYTLICNEEGKLLGLPFNFYMKSQEDEICGTVVVTDFDSEGAQMSLSAQDIDDIVQAFREEWDL